MAREWRIEREGDDEHKDSDRWLVTYSDLITVLLIFFIVLYSLSAKISAKNFDKLAKSLNNSLSKKKVDTKAIDPFALDMEVSSEMKEEAMVVRRALAPFQGKSNVRVDLTNKGMIISLADTSFFDLGSTELSERGKPPLLKIASIIATESNAISVQGHTDNTPAGSPGITNWVIAAQRASSVARYLADAGHVAHKRFEIVSYGEFRPLFPNDTSEHRAMNRRVDIVIQEGPPRPAMTPRPESSDTLPPAFGDPNGGFGTPQPLNNNGGMIPNPFGNEF